MKSVGDFVNAKRDDAALIAKEVADVTAAGLNQVRAAIDAQKAPTVTVQVPETAVNVKVPEQLPPNFHITFPEVRTPEVTVNVPKALAPMVKVNPTINVLPPVPRAYDVRITERDENGFIRAFKITPA